jgi:small subunit ribosomal protein S3
VVSGRLGGADMSRTEQIKKGRIPLQTFRANIDYAIERAYLPYGVIGIKVWIYLGETFNERDMAPQGSQGAARKPATARLVHKFSYAIP